MSQAGSQPLSFNDRPAFRAWVAGQPRGRFEREHGLVIVMAAERAIHARIKARTWAALDQAVDAAGLCCEAFTDGMTVEIDGHTDYEPDVVVTCGDRIRDADTVVRMPLIVVEVLSPSTGYRDVSTKLANYFRLPTVQHYLLVATSRQEVVHHRRIGDGPLATTIHHDGAIELDPPGLRVEVAALYRGTDLAPD